MGEYARHNTVRTEVVAFDAAADVFSFAPGKPVDVIRWGIVVSILLDVGVGFTIKADVIKSGVARDDGGMGSITTVTDVAVGKGLFTENVSPGVTAHPTEPFKLDPGDQVIFQVTDAADTTGDGYVFVEYLEESFVGDAALTAGDDGNRIGNLTKVTV